MAKVSFTKLGLTKNTKTASFEQNDQIVEVKQYLPIEEKMELISSVLNQCQDENNFINEAKMSMFMHLEMAYRYTNVNFTEKQKENPAKLFDLLAGNGFFDDLFAVLPSSEYKSIMFWLDKIAHNIYDYRNSVYGILDALGQDYDLLNLDADEIRDKFANSETLGLLKQVLTKLG